MMNWYWWVLIYFVCVLATCFTFSYNYATHDKKHTMAATIILGLIFPVSWIAYLLIVAYLAGEKLHKKKGQ